MTSIEKLDAAIRLYEKCSCFTAYNYNYKTNKSESLAAKIEAAKADWNWYRNHSANVAYELSKAIEEAEQP